MMTIIGFMKEKNQLLSHFLKLTTEECERLRTGDYQKLQVFYETREGLLKLIKLIDTKIHNLASKDDLVVSEEVTEAKAKQLINVLLDEKEKFVASILDKDLEILSLVESEKSEVIKQLSDVRRGRKAIGAYKSGIR